MIVEDFVMLGRTVPEMSKKHGLVVCSAGYSKELRQFMRVYPITVFDKVPRWSTCRIKLRRNKHDSRFESWRLQEINEIDITGKVKREEEFDFLKGQVKGSIAELNKERASLGMLAPVIKNWRFDDMRVNEEFLLSLFPDEHKKTKKPRLMFTDSHGEHDLQIRDWGTHLFLKNQPIEKHSNLWAALKFTDPTYKHLLFVGNHNNHRTSWLVISVISNRTEQQLSLQLNAGIPREASSSQKHLHIGLPA